MAGHSHWAGIKHRKGRADKQKSKIFSKLSEMFISASTLPQWHVNFFIYVSFKF